MPLSGNEYNIDYIWFPKLSDAGWLIWTPDIAVVHTREPFSGTPLPVMTASTMPDPNNIASYYNTPVTIVGYGAGHTPELDQRRRYGTGKVINYQPGPGVDLGPAFVVEGDAIGGNHYEVCTGDSGGPAIFGSPGSYHVGGVVHSGLSAGDCSTQTTYAYIPRGFLDALCRDSQSTARSWEDCLPVPSSDPDQDGIIGAADNCPTNPNVDQVNSNYSTESGLHGGTNPHPGDACDAKPLATIQEGKVQSVDSYIQGETGGSLLYWLTHTWTKATVFYRTLGFDYALDSSGDYRAIAINDSNKLKPFYCACHNWATSTASSPDEVTDAQICKANICLEGGDNTNQNIYRDTGWQLLNWSEPDGTCPRVDLDGDDPTGTIKPFNECNSLLPDRSYYWTLGGTVYCTDRRELGCTAGDGDKFWKDSTAARTRSFTWDWKSQDYPHNPTTEPIYQPSQTPWARIKVWLRPDSSELGQANNNAYIVPQKLQPATTGSLGKPLYDPPLWRWVLPDLPDPWGPFGPLLVVPVARTTGTDQLPASFDWTPIPESSATRALLVSSVDPTTGAFGEALASRYVGVAELPFDTVGFGAAQVDDALFALGGEDLGGTLSNVLWIGLPGGPGELIWDVPGGIAGSYSMQATGSQTTTASKSSPKTSVFRTQATRRTKRARHPPPGGPGSVESVCAQCNS